jgi:hypothetical protein
METKVSDREYRSSAGAKSRRDRGVALGLSLVVAAAIGSSSTTAAAKPHAGHPAGHHAHHQHAIPQHNRGDHDVRAPSPA